MKTSRLKNKKDIPVSQSQLAVYLGIKSSTLSMANSAKYRRKLPSDISAKLASLYLDFELMEFEPKNPGRSSVQIAVSADKARKKKCQTMLGDAKYLEAGAEQLERKLDNICSSFRKDMRWLHVVDARLAALPVKNERVWLSNQQVITSRRIEKNGILAQLKLQLDIDMARAKAKVYKDICKKKAGSTE